LELGFRRRVFQLLPIHQPHLQQTRQLHGNSHGHRQRRPVSVQEHNGGRETSASPRRIHIPSECESNHCRIDTNSIHQFPTCEQRIEQRDRQRNRVCQRTASPDTDGNIPPILPTPRLLLRIQILHDCMGYFRDHPWKLFDHCHSIPRAERSRPDTSR